MFSCAPFENMKMLKIQKNLKDTYWWICLSLHMKNLSTPGECLDKMLLFDWFLPSPSLRSFSCVLSGWFWQWQHSPLPGVAEPCGLAAEGWRRSPALAEGSGSFCHFLWKSQRSPALTDSQLSPAGSHMILKLRVTSWSLKWEMCLGLTI